MCLAEMDAFTPLKHLGGLHVPACVSEQLVESVTVLACSAVVAVEFQQFLFVGTTA